MSAARANSLLVRSVLLGPRENFYLPDLPPVSPTYEGRRYFVELLAADGAMPGVVTGTIDVMTTDQTP
ncbi:MAG: hypothetical protein OEV00_07345 [Acidobacteriota bacterium]|nr:hypothetical protein [Acidobacteriota bacterium]MDH3785128.1 hypothetical protein [Acidobacteriota bacterium]